MRVFNHQLPKSKKCPNLLTLLGVLLLTTLPLTPNAWAHTPCTDLFATPLFTSTPSIPFMDWGPIHEEILKETPRLLPLLSSRGEVVREALARLDPTFELAKMAQRQVPILEVLPDFNFETDMIIGVREWDLPHPYLIAGGHRIDGWGFGAPAIFRDNVTTADAGVVIRYRTTKENLSALSKAIASKPAIRDLNCWSALFDFIERFTPFHYEHHEPNKLYLPSEYLWMLLASPLESRQSGQMDRQVLPSTRMVSTEELLPRLRKMLVILEHKSLLDWIQKAILTGQKQHLIGALKSKDYRQALRFRP